MCLKASLNEPLLLLKVSTYNFIGVDFSVKWNSKIDIQTVGDQKEAKRREINERDKYVCEKMNIKEKLKKMRSHLFLTYEIKR